MNATGRPKPPTVAELQARAARLRRYALPPLALGWATAVAAVAVDHFRPGEILLLAVVAVLGASTFGFVTGWPVSPGGDDRVSAHPAEDLLRRELLYRQWGKPEQVTDTGAALRLAGRRGDVHPADAIAFRYPSREAAQAYADSNAAHNHVPSLGIVADGGTWVGVLDLRGKCGPVTDAAEPD